MDRGVRRLERADKILDAPDLVVTVNYNDTAKTSVSGVESASSDLGFTLHETFVSGTQTLTITSLIT